MKNIGFYCCDYYPNQSGYSHAFQALISGLIEADPDCTVDVFTSVPLKDFPEIRIDRIRIIRQDFKFQSSKKRVLRIFGNLLIKPYQMAKKINSLNKIKKYNYFILETIEEPLVLSFLDRGILKKSIVRIHATSETEYALWGGGLYQFFRRSLIKHHLVNSIDNISATASYYINFVKKWYLGENQLLIAKKKFSVIPNALLSANSVNPRSEFSEKGSARHFVTLGRMDALGVNQKGFDDILEAINLLSNNQKKLVIITIIGSGSERERLMKASNKIIGVDFQFIEKASNEEVGNILNAADSVILASRYEGMSIFAMEALAHGAPVIFSNAGGIRDLVDGNGLIFEAGNHNQLSKCVGEFLEYDKNALNEMSEKSYKMMLKLTPLNIGAKLVSCTIGLDE